MQGLLDFIKTPEGQGLLSGVFGYAANARRGTPINNLGRGGLAGVLGYSNAIDREQQAQESKFQQQYRQLQMDQVQSQIDKQKQEEASKRQWIESINPVNRALAGGGGPTVANASNVNPAEAQVYPLLQSGIVSPADYAKQFILPKEKKLMTVKPGDVILDERDPTKPVFTAPEKINPNQPFMVVDGQVVPNRDFQQYDLEKASRGAARTNVNVNTEKSFLNSMAGDLGKEVVNARGQAQAAASTVRTANRLMETLDSGRVLAGPTTPVARVMLQLADVFGATGKDSKETLVKTREAMQSLAQLELDAAQQMRGQGQITESERAILRKAASGDVDTMTVTELRTLAKTIDKTGRSKIQSYQQQLQPLVQNPNAAAVAPFLGVEMPEAYTPKSVMRTTPDAPAQGARFLGFEGQ